MHVLKYVYSIRVYNITKYVTGSGKTGLTAHDSRFDFSQRPQSYINNLYNQNQLELSGLLFLTAFLSTVAICTSGLEPQSSSGHSENGCVWLYSPVELNIKTCVANVFSF